MITKSFPAEPASLEAVRGFIASQGGDLDAAALSDLQLATNEAASNSVRHSGSSVLRIRWSLTREGPEVAVEDDGRFHEGPARVEGGWGLRLMAALVDELVVEKGTERRPGTTIRLRKRIPIPDASAGPAPVPPRALIADPGRFSAGAYASLLRRKGYEVVVTTDAPSTAEELSIPPDVVIADTAIDPAGTEITPLLAGSHAPVMVLSMLTRVPAVWEEIGDRILTRPVHPLELLEVASALVRPVRAGAGS